MVGCDEYTDLCTRFHITSFPTVLLFTPSTIDDPVPLTGTLDSTHLLKALGQLSDESVENTLVII
jgi:thioredoxin-related protein